MGMGNNPEQHKKPPDRIAIKVFFKKLVERTNLNVLAADAGIAASEYVRLLIQLAVRNFSLTGRHIIYPDTLSASTTISSDDRPSIAQLLESCDLQQMAADIPYPVERLEELRAGDRPTDKDLTVLSVSSLGLAIEELELLRHIYFDSTQEAPCKN
jgi:hypothetical protein